MGKHDQADKLVDEVKALTLSPTGVNLIVLKADIPAQDFRAMDAAIRNIFESRGVSVVVAQVKPGQDIDVYNLPQRPPHERLRPFLVEDAGEGTWSAHYNGPNAESDCSGYGKTPAEACEAFDKAWEGK